VLGVEPLAFRGARRRGAAAGLWHNQRQLQEVCQFFKTVGDVSRLVAVPLAGNHERPVAGETGPLTLEQPSPYVVWQMRGMNRIETEHRLAAGAIDVLTTWSAAPCKLPLQRCRGDQQLTDTDFLFLGHDAVAERVVRFSLFYTGIHQMTKRMLHRLSLIALVAMALAAGHVVAQELGSLPGSVTERHSPSVADLWTRPGEDWGTFLGPTGNGRSSLKGMTVPWPAGGPRIVWHSELGEGYCGPAVAQGRCVIYDRVGQEIRIRCLAAETGRELWQERYPTNYVDTFGYDGGPRSAAVIVEDAVITFGPEGRLECRSLADGTSRWQVDTSAAYHVVRNFFGVSAAPLVVDVGGKRLVVVQVGGSPAGSTPPSPERLDLVKGLDSGLVAFELATGRECWRSSDQLASYSTPVRATLDGRDSILAWMRDRFLVVDPATGGVRADFRWRADELFSVVAASPVVFGNEVLLSETYGPGSVLLAVTAAGLQPVRRDAARQPPQSQPQVPLGHAGVP
jgi:outer membrane protein assembly factor BamB